MKKAKTDPTKTMLTISVGFGFIYLFTHVNWVLYISLFIGIIGILSNYLSKKVDFLWMKLSELLGLIIPNIILGAIFYIFLFPISILSKLFGKRNLLGLKNNKQSVFIDLNKEYDKSSLEKPW